ncbi:AcrR family transcriptional regulator [Microbacterium resistens]|uniref:AcrR family transcriptional regulator n=1 Tax=Microbacterium resistens TaxID=156977 RepID=A0ABU1SCS3_9MICO|nr:TetR/AcrR family transcriptional regulator [Microbacterium resistens]MDR6867401.1 AcrR family transcriptional regulator [Microbacterium resistens]
MSYWSHRKPILRARAVEVDAIAQASVALLQSGGLRALTVRAVAARIGVAPPSLYSRVQSVHDLFDLALDHALGTDHDVGDALIHAGIHDLMVAYYRHLLRNPWACQVISMRAPRGPHYLRLSERMCVLLEEAGEPDPLSTAYSVSNYVVGSAATVAVASDERVAPVDADIAPVYARLHHRHELSPESILTAGLTALLASEHETEGGL